MSGQRSVKEEEEDNVCVCVCVCVCLRERQREKMYEGVDKFVSLKTLYVHKKYLNLQFFGSFFPTPSFLPCEGRQHA